MSPLPHHVNTDMVSVLVSKASEPSGFFFPSNPAKPAFLRLILLLVIWILDALTFYIDVYKVCVFLVLGH